MQTKDRIKIDYLENSKKQKKIKVGRNCIAKKKTRTK